MGEKVIWGSSRISSPLIYIFRYLNGFFVFIFRKKTLIRENLVS